MALTDIITSRVKKRTVPKIGIVSIDAVVTETHTSSSEPTDHPVESGSEIADHVIVKPRRLVLEGVITNHPIHLPDSQVDGIDYDYKKFTWKASGPGGVIGSALPTAGALGALTKATTGLLGLNERSGEARGYDAQFDRVRDAYEEIDRLVEQRELVTIVTTLREYENMIIEEFVVTRDPATGQALSFTANARQLKIVTTELTDALPNPAKLSGLPKIPRGVQPSKEVNEPTNEHSKSALALLGDNLLSGLGF